MTLPHGWTSRRFDQLGELCSGSTPSSSRTEFWDGATVWVTPTDLSRLNHSLPARLGEAHHGARASELLCATAAARFYRFIIASPNRLCGDPDRAVLY